MRFRPQFFCARGAVELEATRAALVANRRDGQQVLAHAADVASEADVAALFRATLSAFPRLDVLVNNAGVGVGLAETTLT